MRLLTILFFSLIISISFPQQSNLSKAVNQISSYIASGEFNQLRKEMGDLSSVDSIFNFTIRFTKNDYSESLLALSAATLPYREVPIVIPLINSVLNFPLVSADDSIYDLKNKNLPIRFFYDTPTDDYGDKDKLAHFFGFAFLEYSTLSFDFGNLIGYFTEAFEEDFKVQSSIDYRDLEVNFLGKCFGKLLKDDKSILPSQILVMRTLYYFGNPL
ncbi:MAG: hypothetical protein A2V93_01380 [Ignavibacteria bacterium RBG_16_34_14]|nr:MAG: hypothetical protein A2V93_01380 [Ignavibacteria bacterium RBG_16_34_14]